MPSPSTRPPHPLQGLQPGSSFGSYDVVRCIGMGGMGSVFEATHRLMNRRVALKVLHAMSQIDADARRRFLREGATLVRVQHPHIVSVYDAGEIDGVPYIAMELLEGATLDRILDREGILTPERAVALFAPVAEGLAVAHAAGIVHRDVKPENLFLTHTAGGHELLKLVDFGIAKDVRTSGSAKETMIGTPDYMSPEQLLGGDVVDGRADQYALSVVLYQALTGARPFVSQSLLGLALLLEKGDPPLAPSARGVLVPPALETVVLRGLSIPPGNRYGSIGELAAALRSTITLRLGALAPREAGTIVASATGADTPDTSGRGAGTGSVSALGASAGGSSTGGANAGGASAPIPAAARARPRRASTIIGATVALASFASLVSSAWRQRDEHPRAPVPRVAVPQDPRLARPTEHALVSPPPRVPAVLITDSTEAARTAAPTPVPSRERALRRRESARPTLAVAPEPAPVDDRPQLRLER